MVRAGNRMSRSVEKTSLNGELFIVAVRPWTDRV